MSSILTNTSAMVALETLRMTNRSLESVQNEISTGKKVSNAKDNAAIWAISTVMSTDVESFNKITDSLNKGSSTVGVARSAAEQVTGLLQDMKELIVESQEDLNDDDRARLQTEISNMRTTIGNIVNAAQFNGVNLLKGTDSMSVLASLDRASDGTVSATKISIARKDLTTSGGEDAAAKAATDAGYLSTEDTIDATDEDKEATDAGFITTDIAGDLGDTDTGSITFKGGNLAVGDKFSVTVGGVTAEFEVTDAAQTIDDVVTDLATQLNAANGGLGVTDATITTTLATDPTDGADSASIDIVAAGDVVIDPTSFTATYSSSDLAEDESVAFTIKAGTVTAGDTFTINVGGADVVYTAVEGDDANAVANGLLAELEDANVDNLDVEVTEGDEGEDATITLTATGGALEISLAGAGSQNAATTAGGLGALADLTVATAEGATAALTTIETLLETSIGAAAAFGSVQKQLEGQGDFVSSLIDSMTAGIGAMVDADMEAASAKLQALQVQQQLGVQALAIANQAPQRLLSLFQ